MTDDRCDGPDPPDEATITYDAVQLTRNYNHAYIDYLGQFRWVTQGDPTVRPAHRPRGPFDLMLKNLEPFNPNISQVTCFKCNQPFCFVNGDSECPGCGVINAANDGRITEGAS